MHIFYSSELVNYSISDIFVLDSEESYHCSKVLRLKHGDIINLIDGIGGFYTATITENSLKSTMVQITAKILDYQKKNYYLHLAVAPTKNIDRFEWFLEKATEIGVDEITPLLCQNSERTIIKPERLEKLIISAIKQSVTAYLPKINNITKFNEFIKTNNSEQKFIAHCEENKKQLLKDICAKQKTTTILIGPEGDFSTDEINLAIVNNFLPVSLGNSRLRTETAAIVAAGMLSFINT